MKWNKKSSRQKYGSHDNGGETTINEKQRNQECDVLV